MNFSESNDLDLTNERGHSRPVIRLRHAVPVFSILAFLVANQASAALPTLSHLFPAGGQRGSKVIVTCAGIFTWPCQISTAGVQAIPLAESGQIEVTIPADLAADRVWIRLYNAEGASTAQPFLIGGVREIAESEPNDRIADAKVIDDMPVTINGVLKTAEVDCFAVNLAAGQTLVAAVDANTRLGSPIDAILQITSIEGIVLAENHDDLKLDPRLAFAPKKEGIYIVRLFAFPSTASSSIAFAGGADHVYRLTLTTGPFVTHAVPLSSPLETPGSVSVAGWNIVPGTSLTVVPLGGIAFGDQQELELFDDLRRQSVSRIGIAFSPEFAGSARVRLTPLAVVRGLEVTDAKNPMPISNRSSVSGCLKSSGQTDHYRIALVTGEQVLISAESRSLDLPLDPVLNLFDPSGALVSEVDDLGPLRDAFIAYTATQDGDFRIRVSDRVRQGSPWNGYLLTVRQEQPDFELSVASDTIVVSPDKPTELIVKIQRRGTATQPVGPITIQFVGLPASVVSTAVVSEPTGASANEVKLSLSATGVPFNGTVRIVGTATQPVEIERAARTPARLGNSFEGLWLTAIPKP